ncbi:MAG: ABC transporter permease [Candidatus Atribacteria bacterium]|nr:ABC transporter permease [Candidatus Atribacteria bacterium]
MVSNVDLQKEDNQEKSSKKSLGYMILNNPAFSALIFLMIFFAIISNRFFSFNNMINILTQVSITAIIAFGMTLVITSANIDLSVGSVLALAGMIFMALSVSGVHVVWGFIITIFLGAVIGLFDGFLVTFFKLPSFIATLAMMTIARGLALLMRGGTTICQGIHPSYFWLGQSKVGSIPIPVIILIVIFLLMDFLMTRTTFGTYTRAIGSNPEAARLAGISNNRILMIIFAIIGVSSAIAGIITASRLGVGSPITGQMKELDAITAVILGGTAMTGGIGTIKGTFVGALVVTILNNGLTIMGISSYWQQILLGLVLISALAIKRFQRQ